jgi:hypothetical protein
MARRSGIKHWNKGAGESRKGGEDGGKEGGEKGGCM